MSYEVAIRRCEMSTLFDLKGNPAAIADWAGDVLPDWPLHPNSQSERDGTGLYYIGHEHWLLRAPIAREAELIQRLEPESAPSDISVVRISDTLVFFEVTGRDAGQIMAMACPLDLHPSVFTEDCVTYSEVFEVKALMRRKGDGFEVGVDRSFADMMTDYFVRAKA